MKKNSIILISLTVLLLIFTMQVYNRIEADSFQDISKVDQLINDAYAAITRAEEEGFDVEKYISLINDAINLRNLASLLQLEEEYEEATRLANQAKDICTQMIQEIEDKFNQAHQEKLLQNMMVIVFILVVAFLVYKTVRSRQKKPENGNIRDSNQQNKRKWLIFIQCFY